MRDYLLFGLSPYLAAALLVSVPAWRCLATPARRAALTAPASPDEHSSGPVLWRWSLGLVLAAHAVAFLLPQPLMLWNRVPARLLVLEAGGFVLGLAALAGLVRRFRDGWRRGAAADALLLTLGTVTIGSGVGAAALYRWGSDWYATSLLPWFRTLVAFHPDVSLVAMLPPLVKLHVLAGIAAAAVLPFSSAVFALARPAVRVGRLAGKLAASRPGRAALGAAELAMIAVIGVLLTGGLQRVGVSQGYEPPQPIAFSHKLHAGTYHVPCLYCHFAAEKSRHAGVPPAGVCMNCHRQLRVASAEVEKLKESVSQARPVRWIKVHNLPDFVYFNHSQHVGAGVACQRCHGPVETMDRVRQVSPLTMGWCIGCHRDEGVMPPSQRPVAALPARHVATGGLDCGKCHY
ncbi:MAG TPA: respiratory nitrate reductase subunit gamma [Thermoanaerobaculia bacterium]|nr:respiratory nitrate reductase subunit gamma [Thermoanaerobaculia bacterium]